MSKDYYTFAELRKQVNELWDDYGDELADIDVIVEDEDGIIHARVTEITTAGRLSIIIEGEA